MKFIILTFFLTMLISESKYKEPSFTLLETINNIEIRQYNECVVAKTTAPLEKSKPDNDMFKTLASYIFGGNENQQDIPMTAPVTTFKGDSSYDMLFYMLEVDDIEDLPKPLDQNIIFEKFNLEKCAVINFSWCTNNFKVRKYEKQLKQFLEDNNYIQASPFMLNRYNSPYELPWNRKNEILVKIK